MYAIIETGGKQLCVSEGKTFRVDRLAADTGSEINIEKVLMIGGSSFSVGSPYVSGARVTAEVVEHFRGEKVIVFKKRRRQDSRRKQGHRQDYTTIRVKSIVA
ncbi:MAG: 50S ribosomal protein L21 [Desulfovibrionaceae bacterium]|nr:50S ribosomal protein L21 [Desulfovibrionaceae bacterium]